MKERTIKHCAHCNYALRETTIEPTSVVETTCICPNCGEQAKHFLFIEERNLPDEINHLSMRNLTTEERNKLLNDIDMLRSNEDEEQAEYLRKWSAKNGKNTKA